MAIFNGKNHWLVTDTWTCTTKWLRQSTFVVKWAQAALDRQFENIRSKLCEGKKPIGEENVCMQNDVKYIESIAIRIFILLCFVLIG